MSEPTEVPIICEDCGGTLTDDDVYWLRCCEAVVHINYSCCIASLDERLTAATQRAEAAEAERESVSSQLWDCMNEREALRAERDALRTVDDAMVGRFLRAYAECESERPQTFTHRMGVRAALDAALAVQPTTGEGV